MPKESAQSRLTRVRAPRVKITYELHGGNGMQKKELPFVMGVLGDFTGQPDPEKPLAALKDRKFVEINPDNFDNVLKGLAPRVQYSVENKLSSDPKAGKLAIELNFESMADFDPDNVATRVKPLKDLLDLRTELSNARSALIVNPDLDDMLMKALEEALENTESRNKLEAELAKKSEGGQK